MNIALIGYGKMGKAIEEVALERGHQVSLKIISKDNLSDMDWKGIDAAIEFTKPESAVANIKFCLENKIPIAVGTTGWYDHYSELKDLCAKEKGTLLAATNFSLGVNLFFALNEYLAKLMNKHHDYQASMVEIHHTEKLDAPSGTGITLAEGLIANHDVYNSWENVKKGQNSSQNALVLESLREPNVPGTHSIQYENEIDSIQITHTAHNRKGFALGSVLAAEWIKDKNGVFTMRDVLDL